MLIRSWFCRFYDSSIFQRLIPESARWLSSKGKQDKYEKLLRYAANKNGVRLSDEVFAIDKTLLNQTSPDGTFMDIVKSPVLRFRTAVLCLNWSVY